MLGNSQPDLLKCALMILNDQCPPEREMYLCNMGEDDCVDCTLCWENYLFYIANGRKDSPYKWDKIKEAI